MAEVRNFPQEKKIEPSKEVVVKKEEPVLSNKGVITNCACTPMREEPNQESNAKWYLNTDYDLKIIHKESTADFYKVDTTVGKGFVKKEYVELI